MNKEPKSIEEFLETLNIHNKNLGVCFNDAVAVYRLKFLISQKLQEQREGIIRCIPKERAYKEMKEPECAKYDKEAYGYNQAIKEIKKQIKG